MLLLALLACGPDVVSLYEQEKARALATATSVPSGWKPDLTLTLAAPDLARATRTAVEAALHGADGKAPDLRLALPLGLTATLTPDLAVDALVVKPSSACAACFAVDAKLSGTTRWEIAGARGSVPVTVAGSGTLEVAVADGSVVKGRLRDVEKLDVRSRAIGAVQVSPDAGIRDWLRSSLEQAPPIRITEVSLAGLPVRAVSVSTAGDALTIGMLSDVPGTAAVGSHAVPTEGFLLALGADTLTGLARRAAYQAGVQQMDVAVDPRAITVDGATFRLDLRVWRLVGRGWYRDYDVAGDLAIKRKKLTLTATGATEVAQSPRAELVDPLAALFEGKILDAIVAGVQQSLPAKTTQSVGAVQLTAAARDARGEGGDLVVTGDLTVTAPGR